MSTEFSPFSNQHFTPFFQRLNSFLPYQDQIPMSLFMKTRLISFSNQDATVPSLSTPPPAHKMYKKPGCNLSLRGGEEQQIRSGNWNSNSITKIEIFSQKTLNLTARVVINVCVVNALHKCIYIAAILCKNIEKEASLQDQKKFSI